VQCLAAGGACSVNGDCCDGLKCMADGFGGTFCTAPTSPTCTADGLACSTDGQCCAGVCSEGFCGGASCKPAGSVCGYNVECCSGTCGNPYIGGDFYCQ
jgi:hypothetical protein